MTNWTQTSELQAAAARLPSDEGAHAMALFRGGDWRAAVAYVRARLAYHHRSAGPLTADRIIAERRAGRTPWPDEYVEVLIAEIERLRARVQELESTK